MKIGILIFTTLLFLQGTEQKKYTLDHHKIEFTVDTKWEYQKISDDSYAFKFKCAKDVAFCKNIVIKIIKNTDEQSIDQLTQSLLTYISQRFQQHKIISVRDEGVNGRQFKVIDYKFREQDVNLGSTTLVTQRDNEFISIYFTALNQPEASYVNERQLLFELLKGLVVKNK